MWKKCRRAAGGRERGELPRLCLKGLLCSRSAHQPSASSKCFALFLFTSEIYSLLSEHNLFVRFQFILTCLIFFLFFSMCLLMHTGVQWALEFLREITVAQYYIFQYTWALQHCRAIHSIAKVLPASEGETLLQSWAFRASVCSHPSLNSWFFSCCHRSPEHINSSLSPQHQVSLWNTTAQKEDNSEILKYSP